MSTHGTTGGGFHVRILDGLHELTVHSLTTTAEGFTVTYSVTPPLPGDLLPHSPGVPPLFLWLEAVDDRGHHYLDYGGAHGLSADGLRTDGSICGRPTVGPDVGVLTVRLVFLRDGTEQTYDIAFPLSAATR
ncbi:hypothetical protein [Kitasatospora purpeofusca]|uniref:hypothetical protein n=1 Tax=Kitasatospora purpeofusca TaxID=67352 RepID=UPI002251B0A9|nr:hypothetical protein [Kitasatospora purpeofusca]MCX4757103.1 hypothetical protein [Kitasatospora purpeofusca]WSR35135.1 hypothetical protein OG715_31770 [Kitasatospora purpeofusca]